MNNRIPRLFSRITGEMLIETSETRPGDIIRVYKNDMGYLAYNPRTNRHFMCSFLCCAILKYSN